MSRKTPPQSLALQSLVEREEKEMYSPRSKYFPLQIPQSSMARTETLDRTLQQMHCLLSQSFFDGEGCISRRQLTISNTNVELLVYARELLRKFGVESTGPYLGKLAGTVLKDSQTGKLYKRKKNCYYSYVSVRNLPQFAEHIGFTIERKQRRLRAACT